ncbi:MAG: transcriptional regulator [Woeseiaceae bacterium]|nr:transcriptional regulator [Woeseiaceae bacterium]
MRFIRVGDWTVWPESNQIERDGVVRRLEKRSMAVLIELCGQPGRVFSKEALLDLVWEGKIVSDHSVSIVISDLRRALGDTTQNPTFIETIPKKGYRLIADVAYEAADVRQQGTGFRAALAAGISVALLAAGVWLLSLSSETSEHVALGPIIVADVCTDSMSEDISSIAYGFGELLTVSLANSSQRLVLRIREKELDEVPDLIRELSRQNGNSSPVWVSGAIVDIGGRQILTVKAQRSDTKEVIWGGQIEIARSSLDMAAQNTAQEISAKVVESSKG